jgi:hypothetical protein
MPARMVSLRCCTDELLRILVQHAGKVLTHKLLLGGLWDPFTDAQYLRVYVRQLRQKVEDDPERPQYVLIETASATGCGRLTDEKHCNDIAILGRQQYGPDCVHSAEARRFALMIPLISARQEPQLVPALRAAPIASTL